MDNELDANQNGSRNLWIQYVAFTLDYIYISYTFFSNNQCKNIHNYKLA